MTAFVMIAAVLAAGALAWVVVPLVRRRYADATLAREASNLAILKQQLAELETDRAAGTLADEQYVQAKAELERRVLEEVTEAAPAAAAPRGTRRTAIALGVALPALAAALYLAIGNLEGLAPQARPGHENVTLEQVETMVAGLAARLERDPSDARGWSVLARSYYVMQRYPDAVRAYAKLIELVPDDPDVLADYADALAMAQGRDLTGEPLALAQRALKLDPNHLKALALVGTEAFNRKDYKRAIVYWERMQRAAGNDTELVQSVGENIAEARRLAGMGPAPAPKAAPAAAVASVRGTVSLSAALKAKADPSDTVFIFARAAEGPRMPLAVLRRQVKDLPVAFALDDSMAMAPGMNLSSFKDVIVAARISKTADATTRSGDLVGQSVPVKVGASNVAVVINTVAP